MSKDKDEIKELTLKIYTSRGIKRLALTYKINNKVKGYNIPLKNNK